jgi:hypothetical protein
MIDPKEYTKSFQEVYAMLKPLLGSMKALSWMHEKNPNLDNFKPSDYILNGRKDELKDYIKSKQEGMIGE